MANVKKYLVKDYGILRVLIRVSYCFYGRVYVSFGMNDNINIKNGTL
ncbi:hypothetical protein [Candidatus Neoehrlichia procyonis]|uniref:Uncharacterized protein n=1 Tax=Candidatus Neoehrlichia procyonis str. RAC413 TaxID=1359163 RepID=A0A0F3NMC2_9RICK|nr:hypothetical protein [Candidatus Neoehrlichia lotoris]KJV69180.1 hypothetical protein NLO413_0557 [Candidatus Neoehrlichia lotoris str. RAC413]